MNHCYPKSRIQVFFFEFRRLLYLRRKKTPGEFYFAALGFSARKPKLLTQSSCNHCWPDGRPLKLPLGNLCLPFHFNTEGRHRFNSLIKTRVLNLSFPTKLMLVFKVKKAQIERVELFVPAFCRYYFRLMELLYQFTMRVSVAQKGIIIPHFEAEWVKHKKMKPFFFLQKILIIFLRNTIVDLPCQSNEYLLQLPDAKWWVSTKTLACICICRALLENI